MTKRIIAITFIFILTSIAWAILGGRKGRQALAVT